MEENKLANENTHSKSPDVHQFNHLQYWGYGLIIFFYTAAQYAQEWESLKYLWHPSNESNKMLFVLRAILFVILIILSGRWFIATINELEMWSNSELNWSHWTKSSIAKQNAYTAILGLGVLLGLLLAFSNKILLTASLLSLYYLFCYWTQWICNSYFSRALKETRVDSDLQRKRLEIMEYYWLNRPQLARNVTMMFCALISLTLATAASFESEQKYFFEISAYTLLILNIIVGEIIIAKWRNKRDIDLEKIAA
jgi:hypothetical protein